MTIAYGYTRISKEDERHASVSLPAQESRIREWSALRNMTIKEVFTDKGLSGGRADNRPGLQKALNAACEDGAALVIYSLSRLARRVVDTLSIGERLKDAGVTLCSISEQIDTTTAAGILHFQMMAVFGEYERNLVIERTKMALDYKKKRGERTGTVPFGWDLDKGGVQLTRNEMEQRVIKRMCELRAEGQSLRVIAKWLERCKVKTKTGNTRWEACTVRTIIERKPKP